MDNLRRKIIRLPRLDINLEIIAAAALLGSFAVVGYCWPELPDRVPMHYDLAGNPDRWGGKGSLFILPVVSIFTYGLLSVLSYTFRDPKSYPKGNIKNDKQIFYVRRLLTWLKTEIVLWFFYIEWETINIGLGKAAVLSGYVSYGALIIIFITMTIFLIKMARAGKTEQSTV